MIFLQKNFFTLTSEEENKLRVLTLPQKSSGMNFSLDNRHNKIYQKVYNVCKVWVAVDDTSDEWIGWCLARQNIWHLENDCMIYVNSTKRKNGVGKKLLEHAISFLKTQNSFTNLCYPWDEKSREFYSNLAAIHNLKTRHFHEILKDYDIWK